jgi:hypothetical protein
VERWASHESEQDPGCCACFGLLLLGVLLLVVLGLVVFALVRYAAAL